MTGLLMPYGSQSAARLVAKVGRPSKSEYAAGRLMPYGSASNSPVTAKVGTMSKERPAKAHGETRSVTRLTARG